MKITVFGATGKIGQQIISQAMTKNVTRSGVNEIVAFSRNPDKFSLPKIGIQVIKGDVLDRQAVEDAVRGSDAVICALGMPMMNTEGLRTRGTHNIVEAMQATGVDRLICLSMLGVGDSYYELPAFFRYIIFPLFMRRLGADHLGQETCIKNSALDWTIIRPVSFVKGGRSGSYWHGVDLSGARLSNKISHADVADFMLRQLTDATYRKKTPAISYLK